MVDDSILARKLEPLLSASSQMSATGKVSGSFVTNLEKLPNLIAEMNSHNDAKAVVEVLKALQAVELSAELTVVRDKYFPRVLAALLRLPLSQSAFAYEVLNAFVVAQNKTVVMSSFKSLLEYCEAGLLSNQVSQAAAIAARVASLCNVDTWIGLWARYCESVVSVSCSIGVVDSTSACPFLYSLKKQQDVTEVKKLCQCHDIQHKRDHHGREKASHVANAFAGYCTMLREVC